MEKNDVNEPINVPYIVRGYSRDDDMISELRGLMEDAPDEQTKQEFQRLISKMEHM